MREKLEGINGLRKQFVGTFVRFGTKSSFKLYLKKTVLLKDVKCTTDERICTHHLWFNLTKELAKINLKEGDTIRFRARVKEYYKGYKGYKGQQKLERPIGKDYKLSHPTKVRLLNKVKVVLDDFN